jgi:GT2 family glycosyltransferase
VRQDYPSGVDCVVVNYRTSEDLDRFVDSWLDHAPDNARLTIVNVSPTETDIISAQGWCYRRPRIGMVEYEDNIGYGRACNLGAQRRWGDRSNVIALFNADVELTPGTVAACHEALCGEESWAVLGPRQVDNRRRLVHAGIVGTNVNPQHRGWMESDVGQYTDVRDDVPTVAGSAYFIKRSVWEILTACPLHQQVVGDQLGAQAGAFLPTPHYYEETWCSYHARAHGWRCVYFGEVTIVHKWHRATPVGGWAEQQQPLSRAMFRRACDVHGIAHD